MERSTFDGKLRVAVKIRDDSYLCVLNLNLPIDEIVENLCNEYHVKYNKGLIGLWSDNVLSEETKFVTDENKHKVAMGSILYLKDSPTILAEKLFITIQQRMMTNDLLIGAEDSAVLNILHKFNAHIEVFDFLDSVLDYHIWVMGLKFIHKLCIKNYIRRVDRKIVKYLLRFIKAKSPIDVLNKEELIIISLRLLCAIRRFGRLRYDEVIFDDLAALLLHQKHPVVQECSLELLNFLVLFPNDEEEEKLATKRVVNQKIIGCICEHILRDMPPNKSMQQQLYRYQTLVLRPYWYKKVTKVLNNDKAMKLSRKLTQRAKEGELPTRRRRVASFSNIDELPASPPPAPKQRFFSNLKSSFRLRGPLSNSLKKEEKKTENDKKWSITNLSCLPNSKLGSLDNVYFNFYGPIHHQPIPAEPTLKKASSISTINSTIEERNFNEGTETVRKDPALSTRSTSELTISCLNYQAENYAEHHQKWALTRKGDYAFGEQITKVVCSVLEIGRPRPPDDPGDTFNPLVFFCYPNVFEEMFCEAYLLYDRTSREMRANKTTDVAKVLSVVEEQIYYTFHPYFLKWDKNRNIEKPTSLEQMRENLQRINYQRIEAKRQEDREERMQVDLRHKPMYVEYRETRKVSVLETIKRQRLEFATTGEHFLKVNIKGEIVKYQKLFLKLNLKHSKLITGECVEGPKTQSELQCNHHKFIAIKDIVDVSIGKQSKFYKDIFLHNDNWLVKSPQNDPEHWSWLMSIKMKDNVYINFCSVSLKSAHYWLDAIHSILGKTMSSPTKEEELNEFLDMEVRLHFLDLEMLPIPDIPPIVPPLPTNFNFIMKEKKRPPNRYRSRTAFGSNFIL